MKKILIALAFYLISIISLNAQNQSTSVSIKNSAAVSTQVTDVRYEFIQSSANSSLVFLVDKYTGRVWRYRSWFKDFEEIKRVPEQLADTTRVNYQLYMSGENSHMCFLLNVHTGQMWRYSTKEGNKQFMSMSMPWENE